MQYVHDFQGINGHYWVRNIMLGRSTELKLTSKVIQRDSERVNRRASMNRKLATTCFIWILAPKLSSWVTVGKELNFSAHCFLICKTWTTMHLPHTVVMNLMESAQHSSWHKVDSTGRELYCSVQKLLHCFSIKINHIPLGLMQPQKLDSCWVTGHCVSLRTNSPGP